MKTISFLSAAFISLLFFSCDRAHTKNQNTDYNKEINNQSLSKKANPEDKALMQPGNTASDDAPSPQEPATADSTKEESPIPTTKTTTATGNMDWDKKIIKTATLNVEVKNFKVFNSNLHKTIHDFGGYVAEEEQNQYDDRLATTVAIKVPVAQFDALVNQLVDTGVVVKEKKITSEDVTSEVVDTKARLEAKKQMRLKYYDFLKQSKNIGEALQVQKEINDMQEDIESADGRVGYLSHESAFSTINLTYFQSLNSDIKPADVPVTFFSRIGDAFYSGAKWIADLFVGLMTIWPLLLVVISFLIYWKKIRPAKQNVQPKL